jgi:hypothetical protein
MDAGKRRIPLTAVLWFIAAILAWSAVAIRAFGRGHVDWGVAAAGLFCAGMGLSAYVRALSSKSSAR